MSVPTPEFELTEERAAERALIAQAAATDEAPMPGFVDWVMRSVAHEPMPRRGPLAALAILLTAPGPYRLAAQAAVMTLTLVAGIGAAAAIGELSHLLPDNNLGSSPSPMPSPEASATMAPSPSPSLSPSPTPSPTPAPTAAPASAPATDDDESESETPHP